jgi:predicted DNA binding CopG/RHH family protein
MLAKSAATWGVAREESDAMNKQEKQLPTVLKVPKFLNEDEEAKWWASPEGREFLKRKSAAGTTQKQKGSPLVAGLGRTGSVQIALRLPAPDLAQAREIADRKGIGYQTLLKMLLHEGLRREARRQ